MPLASLYMCSMTDSRAEILNFCEIVDWEAKDFWSMLETSGLVYHEHKNSSFEDLGKLLPQKRK